MIGGGLSVYGFGMALTIREVGIADGIAYGGKAASIVPGHGFAHVVSRTTKNIISDSFPIVGDEFVFPYTVVSIGMGGGSPGLGFYVSAVIVGVGIGCGGSVCVGLDGLCDLAVFVVGVGLLAGALVFDIGDVAPCIVSIGEFGYRGAGAAKFVGVGTHQVCGGLSGLAVHSELGGLVLQGGVELFSVCHAGFRCVDRFVAAS